MSQQFYKIGTRFKHRNDPSSVYMLCNVNETQGNFICTASGYRWCEPFDLSFSGAGHGIYASTASIYQMEPAVKEQVSVIPEPTPLWPASKPNKIKLYRYIRPYSYKHGQIDSQQGITLAISIDYTNNIIEYGVSCCNGDNFNKNKGKWIADDNLMRKKSSSYFIVLMDEGKVSELGCVQMLIEMLDFNLKDIKSAAQKATAKRIIDAYEDNCAWLGTF